MRSVRLFMTVVKMWSSVFWLSGSQKRSRCLASRMLFFFLVCIYSIFSLFLQRKPATCTYTLQIHATSVVSEYFSLICSISREIVTYSVLSISLCVVRILVKAGFGVLTAIANGRTVPIRKKMPFPFRPVPSPSVSVGQRCHYSRSP